MIKTTIKLFNTDCRKVFLSGLIGLSGGWEQVLTTCKAINTRAAKDLQRKCAIPVSVEMIFF